MSNAKNTAKNVNADEQDGAQTNSEETAVPQQKTEPKVVIVKGAGVDEKDAIIITEEIVDEETLLEKAKGVFSRNRKLFLGLAAATTAAVLFAVFRDVEVDSDDEPSTDSEDEGTVDDSLEV